MARGSIYPRPLASGQTVYDVRYRSSNGRQCQKRGLQCKREAQEYLTEQLALVHKGKLIVSDVRFAGYWDRWLKEHRTLRRAARDLDTCGLLTATEISTLGHDAARDAGTYEEQAERRARYPAFRDDEAHRRNHDQPLTKRLRHGDEHYLDEIDAEYLRRCDSCNEIAYPHPQLASAGRDQYLAARRCAFCRDALREPRHL